LNVEEDITKMDIINNCAKNYRIDHEIMVREILKKVPTNYLEGLSRVVLVCEDRKLVHRMEYFLDRRLNQSTIEVSIDMEDYNKHPFFSKLSFNIDFISKVNEHIEKSVKPYSNDPNILMHNSDRINYKWMYLEGWTPILFLFKIMAYPISKIQYLRKIIFRYSKKIMGE
jgi:hypothetical protein